MTESRQSPPQSPAPKPSMQPTSPAALVVAALAAAALAWLAISRFYGDIPTLPWLPVITVAALAVLEGYAALATKARIDRRPGREPVDPLLVARFVVLAKASSMAGAIFGGLYAGVTGWLLIERQRLTHAAADLPAAAGGLAASCLLVAAALWLERSCRVPKQPDDTDDTDSDRTR
jgi:hypothetical protein